MPAVPRSCLQAFVLGDVRLLRAALLLLWKREGRRLRAVSFQVGRKED
jgi:hypothetical protein